MIHLRQIRKSRNMTMKELGKKVGVSEATIGYYETEKRMINYEMLLKLAEALDCSIIDIIEGEKIPVTKSDGMEEIIDLSQLSEDQKVSIQDLTKLNPHFQALARGLIESLLSSQQDGDTQ